MTFSNKSFVLASFLGFCLALMLQFAAEAAAPPVRIAVVPGGGSGMEQDVVDRISSQLQSNEQIVLSTVNADWYVVCNVKENIDQASGQIRYNGTVLVKTTDGQVIGTYAVQKYNQDFSLSPGAPLNKALVDGAARDVIGALAQRAIAPIQQAVVVEMETRERVMQAGELASQDKYDDAIGLLSPITPDTAHFGRVQKMMQTLVMEQQSLKAYQSGLQKQKEKHYAQAIASYKQVSAQSKRIKLARQKVAECTAALKH
ncbi:MAG: hypothetical protein P4L53_02065 [Candidatus Obscuribacterales bacterium]|nr:hypothetical protein [Candidatus Obscuribacterales bacterium]